MEMVIGILIWFACGFVAWCACLADFYSIGLKFPSLGTGDYQWNTKEGRQRVLGLACAVFMAGPLGLVVAVIATGFFKTGFRVW